jgi:hypothetical protein
LGRRDAKAQSREGGLLGGGAAETLRRKDEKQGGKGMAAETLRRREEKEGFWAEGPQRR